MKILFTFTIWIISLSVSAKSLAFDYVEQHCSIPQIEKSKVQTVTDDNYYSKILKDYSSWQQAKKLYADMKIIKVDNKHDPSIESFITKYQYNKDKLTFFFNGKNHIPMCLQIYSNIFDTNKMSIFNRKIDYFRAKYKLENSFNVLEIITMEGLELVQIHFRDNRVFMLNYRNNYLD